MASEYQVCSGVNFFWAAGGAAFAGKPPSVLVHEHVLVDFVGADQIRRGGTTATRCFASRGQSSKK